MYTYVFVFQIYHAMGLRRPLAKVNILIYFTNHVDSQLSVMMSLRRNRTSVHCDDIQ